MPTQQTVIDDAARTNNWPVLKVAVCGEISSGKSTVLNALLRARVLPDNVGRESRPVIVASYRAQAGLDIHDADGQHTRCDGAADPDVFRGAAKVQLWTDQAHLVGVELVEVPLTTASDLTEAQCRLIGSCDVMIWVTIASQAWRLTEQSIVEQLGDARPRHGILAVSRADKLRTARDRRRLRERLVRETGPYFDSCIFVCGFRQTIDAAAGSEDVWIETGAPEILSTIRSFGPGIRNPGSVLEEAPARPAGDAGDICDIAEFRARSVASGDGAPDVEDATADVPNIVEDRAAAAQDAKPSLDEAPETKFVEPPADRPGPGPTEAMDSLRQMAGNLAGAHAAGLTLFSAPDASEALAGDATTCRELGMLCDETLRRLTKAFGVSEVCGQVSSLNLSMHKHRLLFQVIPDVGLVFILVDASVASSGLAQLSLNRMCQTFDAEA